MLYAPKSETVTAYQYDGSYKSLKKIFSLLSDSWSLTVEGLNDDGTMDNWFFDKDGKKLYFPVGTWIVKKDVSTRAKIVPNDIFKEKYISL